MVERKYSLCGSPLNRVVGGKVSLRRGVRCWQNEMPWSGPGIVESASLDSGPGSVWCGDLG